MEGRFKEASSISTYVFGITNNLWKAYLRKEMKARQIEISDIGKELVSEQEHGKVDLSKTMHRLLDELGGNCKKILYMYYYENKSMLEVKKSFDLGSEQAAKTKKYRCMQQLIKLFKKRNITPDSILNLNE